MRNQAITKKSLDYGFVWDHIKGRLNSHFSLVYMPCFPIRFVNRNDKEINVFLFLVYCTSQIWDTIPCLISI